VHGPRPNGQTALKAHPHRLTARIRGCERWAGTAVASTSVSLGVDARGWCACAFCARGVRANAGEPERSPTRRTGSLDSALADRTPERTRCGSSSGARLARSACGRTPAKRAPFALTLRAPELVTMGGRLGSGSSDAWAEAVRVVVRRSSGRSACGRTLAKRGPFALTLRAPDEDLHRSTGVFARHRNRPHARHEGWPARVWQLGRLSGRGAGRRPALVWPFGVRTNASEAGAVRADAASAGGRPAPQQGVSPASR